MTKDDIAEAVTQWFNMDRYEVIHHLTVEEMFIELERRVIAYNLLSRYKSLNPKLRALVEIHEERIKAGEVLFGAKFGKPDNILSSSYIAKPITVAGVKDVAEAVNIFSRHIGPEEEAKRSKQLAQYLREARLNDKGVMFVEINLSEGSTEDIIEHLKVMVPKWKKELKVKSPEPRDYRFGVSTIKKTLEYNIIPMMDLLFWELKNDGKIGVAMMTRLLYPKLINKKNRGEGKVKATDYPLTVSFLTNPSYLKSLGDFLIKYDMERNWKVSELIDQYLPQEKDKDK
jgi:hypothetical protein